ncbi:hypothetical protein VBM87_01300 [Mycoplasma sp. 744]|uniref:hypothetical protein n=1 Tax=Mycoplasma sp. 744 TaxID=3108531 RepID=UPI002B1E7A70|nr:hypothetical protein [Mycoplasma sp. 744]MEA4115417.1 hypothetical protein [Mycoplasma sp. 744]
MKNNTKNLLKKKIISNSLIFAPLAIIPVLSSTSATSNLTVSELTTKANRIIQRIQRERNTPITEKLIESLNKIKAAHTSDDTITQDLLDKVDFHETIFNNILIIDEEQRGHYLDKDNIKRQAFFAGSTSIGIYFDMGNQKSYVASYMADIVYKEENKNLSLEEMKQRLKNENLRAQTITYINSHWPIDGYSKPEQKNFYPNDIKYGIKTNLTELMNMTLNESPVNISAASEKFEDIETFIKAIADIKDNVATSDEVKAQWDASTRDQNNLPFTTRKEWIEATSGLIKEYDTKKADFDKILKQAVIKSTAIMDIMNSVNGSIGINDENTKTDLIKKINAIDYTKNNGLAIETKYELLEATINQIKEISANQYLTQKDKDTLIKNLANVFTPNVYDDASNTPEEKKTKLVEDIKAKDQEIKNITNGLTEIYRNIQQTDSTTPDGENTIDKSFLTYEEINANIQKINEKNVNDEDYLKQSQDYLKRNKTLIEIGKLEIQQNHKPNVNVINDFNIIPQYDSAIEQKLENELNRAKLIKEIEDNNFNNQLSEKLINDTINYPQVNENNTNTTINSNFASELELIKNMLELGKKINQLSDINENSRNTILNRYVNEVKNTNNLTGLTTVKTNNENRLELIKKVQESTLKDSDKQILYTAIANLETNAIELTPNKSQAVKNLETILEKIPLLNSSIITEDNKAKLSNNLASLPLTLTQEQFDYAINEEIAQNNEHSKLSLLENIVNKTTTKLTEAQATKLNQEILNVVFDYTNNNNQDKESQLIRIKNKLDLVEKIYNQQLKEDYKQKLVEFALNFNIANIDDFDTNNLNSKINALEKTIAYAQTIINEIDLNDVQEEKYLTQLFTNDPSVETVNNFEQKVSLVKTIKNDQNIGNNDKNELINKLDELNPSNNDFVSDYQKIKNDYDLLTQKRNVINEINNKLNQIHQITNSTTLNEIVKQLNKETTVVDKFKTSYTNAINNKENDNLLKNELKFYEDIRDNLNADFAALNFDSELAKKLAQLNNLKAFNKNQITIIKDKLKDINDNTTAKAILDQVLILDNVWNALKEQVKEKDNLINNDVYQLENAQNKKAYDDALNKAEEIIQNLENQTFDNLNVSTILNQINQTTNALNDLQNSQNNLDGKRNTLKTQIDKTLNLSDDEKSAFKNKVDALDKDLNQDKIDEIKLEAFNQAKTNVKTKINQLQDLAQEEKDQLYDELEKAPIDNNILDHKLQEILDKANEANKKKTDLKDFLDNTQYLNDAQKTALRNEITLAHSNGIDELKTKIQALDDLMKEYKEIQTLDKNDIKYSQADENPQKAYDNALDERENIINKTNGLNLNKEQIETKINDLKQAENNLNGQEKIKKAQENAINRINNEYSSLTEAQKTKAIEKINQINNLEQINQADNENKVLNGQMQTLRDYLANEKTLKADNNYINASPDKKQVYDQEIIKTQNLLKQLEENNNNNLLNENLVNQQNQNLHNAIDNLNGNNIAEARKQVIDYINQLNNLNDKQKENLIAQVNKEVENEKILAIKDLANNINQTMQNLKNQLAKYANLATDKKYLNATSEKKLTFEDIKNQAANLVDKEKGANVIDQKTIEQLAKDLEAKYNNLDGEQLLKNKQNQAKENIDQLANLNNTQKEVLKNEIDNVLLIADVDDIVNKALTLDNLMQQLANTLQDLENELNQENNDSYKAASPRTKNNYDKLKNQVQDLLKTNSMQNLDSQAVNQLEKDLIEAKEALDGDLNYEFKKEKIKQSIQNNSHLNQKEKDKLIQQIDNIKVPNDVNNAEQIKWFNEQVDHLLDKKDLIQEIKNKTNLTDEQQNDLIDDLLNIVVNDQENQTNNLNNFKESKINLTTKENLYQKVKNEPILNQADKETLNNLIDNLDPTNKDFANKVNEFNNKFNELINKQKDQNAQKELSEFLKQTKYINNAQKEALEKEIANLNWQNQNFLKNKIILLDQAMRTYNDIQIIDTNNINYSQADLDLKQAYDKALNNQKQIIDKIKGNNLDLNQVNQAINELRNAINNLNGYAKVNKQKELIKNKINKEYQALTNKQKDKAIENINRINNLDTLKELDANYQNINNLMLTLRANLNNKFQITTNNNYYDASKENKNNYDQVLNDGEKLLNNLIKQNNDLFNINLIKTTNQNILDAIANLNGQINLVSFKEEANKKVNNLENYSLEEKNQFKQQIQNAKDINQVKKILNQLVNHENALNKEHNKYIDWLILILLWTSIILTFGLTYLVWLLVKKFNNKK